MLRVEETETGSMDEAETQELKGLLILKGSQEIQKVMVTAQKETKDKN